MCTFFPHCKVTRLCNQEFSLRIASFASTVSTARFLGYSDSQEGPPQGCPRLATTGFAANYRGKKLAKGRFASIFLTLFEITSISIISMSCSANDVVLCPLV